MTRKSKFIIGVVLALVMALGFASLFQGEVLGRGPIELCENGIDDDGDGVIDETTQGGCTSGDGAPTSGAGIVPELWTDNPSCEDLGFSYGFKIEGNGASVYTGTFYFTSADGILTGGAPEDPFNYVTLTSNGTYLDWESSLPLEVVYMKGGPGGNAYVYDSDYSMDTGLATPDGGPALSHVEFCYHYQLTATKTADASWKRTYTWDITKEEDGTYEGFIGDAAFDHDYTVTVDQTVVDSDFIVSGKITVNNPTPFEVPFTIDDQVDGVKADVTCPDGFTLAAGASTTCTYSAILSGAVDGTNIATIDSGNPLVLGTEATANYAFGDPEIIGYPTINVTDDQYGDLGEASASKTFNYSLPFQCSSNPADYTAGVWTMTEFVNTAKIIETGLTDDAKVNLTCYAPVLYKDASTYWEKKYDWTITKEDDGTYTGFIGDAAFDHDYIVEVKQTITDQNFKVYGDISVSNPTGSPNSMNVSLADLLAVGYPADVDCDPVEEGLQTSVTVAPGETETCSYSGFLDDKTDGTNTATGSFNSIDFEATANYAFGDPEIIGYPTINVTDDQYGDLGEASASKTFNYSLPFQCSSNPADYTAGVWTMTEFVNTAKIIETGLTDDAKVNLTCYAPIISKTADASYDERHDWNVKKTVTDPVGPFYPGDIPSWTWTIDVIETVKDQNFAVTGGIKVSNPVGAPASMTVALADVLDDGTPVTLACGGSLTVAAGATETCGYSAVPNDASATLNTATGTFNNIDFIATAAVNFIKNVINDSASLSDDEIKLDPVSVSGGDQFTKTEDDVCSSNWSDYGADGTYTVNLSNTAVLTDEEGTTYESTATTSYTCEAGTVDLLKLTNGLVDPSKTWTFNLYIGPDGFGSTPIATDNTSGDADGVLFDDPQLALRPDTTYTICELAVPAGYSSRWELPAGSGILTYNPDADNETPEDLGNRCYDFTVSTGQSLHFKVDNVSPGGDPRTPGYWKNWNRCTGGGQQYTADANGGYEEGFWLLEDVLNVSNGGAIVWDDILDDGKEFEINSCAIAVDILDKREIGDPEEIGDGKKKASDPLINLATHLLAAQLNFGAGACTTQDVLDAALAAEELLDQYDFNGTAGLMGKKDPNAKVANELADYLDRYNNGEFCGSLVTP